MIFNTERLSLRTPTIGDSEVILDYLNRNREFFEEWDPIRDDEYYTVESIKSVVQKNIESNEKRSGLFLYIAKKQEEKVIGFIGLSNIVYGVFQSCFLGYKLDKDEINKGYMTEGLKKIIEIGFVDYKLHRIEANVMPRNKASRRILKKLGFRKEGMSRKYLRINGKWEDHIHYVLLNKLVE